MLRSRRSTRAGRTPRPSYAAAVKPGDQVWLNCVNSVLHEAMTGVEFLSYQASFEKWFGQKIEPPRVGFPVEYS